MKDKKKILIIAFLLIIIGVIMFCFYLRKAEDKNKDQDKNTKITDDLASKKEKEEESLEAKTKEEVKPQEEESATKAEENKKEVVKPTPNVKPQPKVVQKPKQNPTPKPKPTPTPVKPQPKPQPKQEQKPWEKLGLTEDQYKNQPMYSWEKVDFKTREECINYGNTHAPFSTGEGGYECSEVTSYTRTLGWDWEPRYLKGN